MEFVVCLQDAVCRCLIDIAAGMDYLHSLGVLHGADNLSTVLLRSLQSDHMLIERP